MNRTINDSEIVNNFYSSASLNLNLLNSTENALLSDTSSKNISNNTVKRVEQCELNMLTVSENPLEININPTNNHNKIQVNTFNMQLNSKPNYLVLDTNNSKILQTSFSRKPIPQSDTNYVENFHVSESDILTSTQNSLDVDIGSTEFFNAYN